MPKNKGVCRFTSSLLLIKYHISNNISCMHLLEVWWWGMRDDLIGIRLVASILDDAGMKTTDAPCKRCGISCLMSAEVEGAWKRCYWEFEAVPLEQCGHICACRLFSVLSCSKNCWQTGFSLQEKEERIAEEVTTELCTRQFCIHIPARYKWLHGQQERMHVRVQKNSPGLAEL